jgi:molecular chaperone GrpE
MTKKRKPELTVVEDAEQDVQQRVQELEAKLAEANDGMLRAIADLQNYRRRAIQEGAQAREAATADLVRKLLPILDNFERTLEAAENGASREAVLEGVRLVDRQFRSVLEEWKVKAIPAVGQPFDPHLHEAVVSAESEHEEGTVIEELERGYSMGHRVLRPTKARVSKGPAA